MKAIETRTSQTQWDLMTPLRSYDDSTEDTPEGKSVALPQGNNINFQP